VPVNAGLEVDNCCIGVSNVLAGWDTGLEDDGLVRVPEG